ncbi:MAG: relaxase/mobilization nuclease domain-containing protein [Chitinophagales bacterium]|nr:relaxase/mobilization nuclease domain-containing protein [Chitinophagales bacterium]
MIIKSLSRQGTRRSTVKQLLTYILTKDKHTLLVTHNLTGNSLDDLTDAYMENEQGRIYHRTNNTLVMHEILSMHTLDTTHLSTTMLRQIAQAYINRRSPHGLAVAAVHHDTQSVHIHLAISGITLTGRSTRISQQTFSTIKHELQERFPELTHSKVAHGSRIPTKREKEYHLTKRTRSEKETLKQLLETLFHQSTTRHDFYERIRQQGMELYSRNDTVTGIIGTRKYRFTTLGFGKERMHTLDLLHELGSIRKQRTLSHDHERE